MTTLHPDLLLLAAVAWDYGERDIACSLYTLAQASSHLTPPMQPADVQLGLQLMGLDSFRIVGPGLDIPELIWDALDMGHVVLAQIGRQPSGKKDQWMALCGRHGEEWHGLAVTSDWSQCSYSSQFDVRLTGHYVAVARVLPEWEP